MNQDIYFCRTYLANLRREARNSGIKLPKGLTALKSGVGSWWLVESRDGQVRQEVCAHNAYEARAKIIEKILDQQSA